MAKIDSLSTIELFAVHLALEAECADGAIDQIAKSGRCSDELVAMAEQVRDVVAELRAELHAHAPQLGMSPDDLDVAFSDFLAAMLERTGSVH
jgi:hypothetical protein